MEFSALANHRPAIRAEITAAAERIRGSRSKRSPPCSQGTV